MRLLEPNGVEKSLLRKFFEAEKRRLENEIIRAKSS